MSPEEEEKKMPFIVATYVYASSQGQRTLSARTKAVSQTREQKRKFYSKQGTGKELSISELGPGIFLGPLFLEQIFFWTQF
jgi:hypothetical protein